MRVMTNGMVKKTVVEALLKKNLEKCPKWMIPVKFLEIRGGNIELVTVHHM